MIVRLEQVQSPPREKLVTPDDFSRRIGTARSNMCLARSRNQSRSGTVTVRRTGRSSTERTLVDSILHYSSEQEKTWDN
jgi:hypothetical protein